MSKIAVVTVNWNGWRMTLDCIASLRASSGAEWKAFIVDNASSDDSIEHLESLGDDVILIRSNVNGGWTGGNNLGVLRALQEGYDHIFLLNNDAIVETNTLARLLAATGSREIPMPPVIGPVHRHGDNVNRYDFIGSHIDDRTGMPVDRGGTNADLYTMSTSYDVAFISGAGMLINRRHIETIGLFDDRFYLNYDETDWCYRARKAGFPVRLISNATIIHASSGSIGGLWSPLNIYFLTRNSLLFAKLHSSWRQRLAHAIDLFRQGRNLTCVSGRWRRLLLMLFGRAPRLRAFRAGVRDYILHRFGDCPKSIRSLGRTSLT